MKATGPKLTVFIGTFNRLDTLQRTVDSYQRFQDATPHELVIVDNGTDHPDCLRLLAELEQRPEVCTVYPLPKVMSMDELTENFNVAIRDHHDRGPETRWYAVTDADISFEETHPKALAAYIRLARKRGWSVGPHTRVDHGIPDGYPLRSRVLATESRLLYRDSMQWLGNIPFSAWQIDTTFHLFPRTRRFHRLHMNTVRVGPPYDARHLDWYIDVTRPTAENTIYLNTSTIASWGGQWLREYWRAFQESAAAAFRLLLKEPRRHDDLCNASFMLSWCHQFGHTDDGVINLDASRRALHQAVPAGSVWRPYRADWMRMIYGGDFSMLGWA